MATACRGLEADRTVIVLASDLALRSTSLAAWEDSPFLADLVHPIRAVASRTSEVSHIPEPEGMRHIPRADHKLLPIHKPRVKPSAD